jgi:hypothetical protein
MWIYYEEFAPVILEPEESHDLLLQAGDSGKPVVSFRMSLKA